MAGSHKLIGEFLQRREPAGCSYMRLFWYAHWVYNGIAALGLGRSGRTPMEVVQAAPCRAGDVLIMHPFLVHSASLNYSTEMRLAFNLGVRWRSDDANELLDMEALVRAYRRGERLAPLQRSLAAIASHSWYRAPGGASVCDRLCFKRQIAEGWPASEDAAAAERGRDGAEGQPAGRRELTRRLAAMKGGDDEKARGLLSSR